MYQHLSKCMFLIFSVFCLSGTALALDVQTFSKLAKDTIRQVRMGVVGDIDAMIAVQESLMALGVEGSVKYAREHRENSKPLILAIENAEKMRWMKLDEMEKQWHEGEFLRKRGVDMEKLDHFSPMSNLMDAIIHPATSYLLLKEYKKTGDTSLLVRVRAELHEVLEHVKHLNSESDQAKVN